MARRKVTPQVRSEAQAALDDLADLFWRVAIEEVSKQLDKEDQASPQQEKEKMPSSERGVAS
jgi:hypothetical protein